MVVVLGLICHIIPIAAHGQTQKLKHAPTPQMIFFLKASAVRPEKCAPAPGGTAAFKAVRGDVAEMWLPVRRSAPHLRTRRSHTAPWIDPG